MPQDIRGRDVVRSTGLDDTNSAVDCYVPALNSAADVPIPLRALRANSAGTVIVHTAGCYDSVGNPTPRTLNFLAGETRSICIMRLLTGGTIPAADLEAMT